MIDWFRKQSDFHEILILEIGQMSQMLERPYLSTGHIARRHGCFENIFAWQNGKTKLNGCSGKTRLNLHIAAIQLLKVQWARRKRKNHTVNAEKWLSYHMYLMFSYRSLIFVPGSSVVCSAEWLPYPFVAYFYWSGTSSISSREATCWAYSQDRQCVEFIFKTSDLLMLFSYWQEKNCKCQDSSSRHRKRVSRRRFHVFSFLSGTAC